MKQQFIRSEALFGGEGLKKLEGSRVAVFGIGGVGGHCVDALARSGIGAIDLIDSDAFSISNINRQIFATLETVGQSKVLVAAEHIKKINPEAIIRQFPIFFCEETKEQFNLNDYDYIVDAIDSVKSKVLLISEAKKAGIPIISSMGAGNKLEPTLFEVCDIYKTSHCPLARVMRNELKRCGVESLKVVYSKEQPKNSTQEDGKSVPSSCAFVPSVAGLIIASEVVKDLIAK